MSAISLTCQRTRTNNSWALILQISLLPILAMICRTKEQKGHNRSSSEAVAYCGDKEIDHAISIMYGYETGIRPNSSFRSNIVFSKMCGSIINVLYYCEQLDMYASSSIF
ncbi:hypothetical protein RND81_04G073000 [Saponaria officinalis]|uniref:Uncharacterized protein n=1 Tax=Saponaria officinalis TaxID=3572 RepID=A0AAW1LFJ2_SAPOF